MSDLPPVIDAPPIEVTLKSVYGTERIYPCNAAAQSLCELTGTRTLELRHLRVARSLGHRIAFRVGVAPEWIKAFQAEATMSVASRFGSAQS